MVSESPVAFPLVFFFMIFSLVFVMLTLLLKAVDSAYMNVMERQKYEKDNFVEELKEAAILLARETYWGITAPIQLFLVQRRIKQRILKRNQLIYPEENNDGDDSNKHKEIEMKNKNKNKKSVSRKPVPQNDMERYTELKSKISTGKYVSEQEVKVPDIIETSAFLKHRQGVLDKRLTGLVALMLELGLDDGDLDSDEDDMDEILDPNAHPGLNGKANGADSLVSTRSKMVSKPKASNKNNTSKSTTTKTEEKK